MEDIRLGRASGGITKIVTASAASRVPLVPADENRTRLIVSTGGGFTAVVGPAAVAVEQAVGFCLTVSTPMQVFRIEEYGILLRQAWFCSGIGGDPVLCVADIGLEKQ